MVQTETVQTVHWHRGSKVVKFERGMRKRKGGDDGVRKAVSHDGGYSYSPPAPGRKVR